MYKFKGIDEEVEKYMCIQCFIMTIMALICAVFVESEVIHIFGPIFVKYSTHLIKKGEKNLCLNRHVLNAAFPHFRYVFHWV